MMHTTFHPVFPPPPARARLAGPWAEFLRGYFAGFVAGAFALFAFTLAAMLLFPAGRTNILVLGLDRRPQEDTFASRTDTMMLVTVYPREAYVGMLSIPRDLYVTLPSGVQGRINTAHFLAESEAPGAGPAAAMETVQRNFGVEVHRYVRMDLAGFVKIVDAVEGITLDVPRALIDYEYPTYDYGVQTISFEAGPQHMDGDQALAYARIRHGSSDFQRAERQQAVLQALLARLLRPSAWAHLPALAAAVNESVDTNLTPIDLARLAPTVLYAGPAGLDQRVVQGDMVQSFTTESGGSVQLPVWDEINPVLEEMFGQSSPLVLAHHPHLLPHHPPGVALGFGDDLVLVERQ